MRLTVDFRTNSISMNDIVLTGPVMTVQKAADIFDDLISKAKNINAVYPWHSLDQTMDEKVKQGSSIRIPSSPIQYMLAGDFINPSEDLFACSFSAAPVDAKAFLKQYTTAIQKQFGRNNIKVIQ